jgi:hypothetical protein
MKLQAKLITVSALALAASSVFAAETVTLKVTGTLVAPSCDVNMPSDTADFGDIARGNLSVANNTALSTAKTLSVTVTCAANTAISIKTQDNVATGKSTDTRSFDFGSGPVQLPATSYANLGLASNGNPIGAYAVQVGTVTVDGATAAQVATSTDNTTWTAATGSVYFSTVSPYITARDASSASIQGKVFSFPVTVAANVSATNTLPNEELNFSGSTDIEVMYL